MKKRLFVFIINLLPLLYSVACEKERIDMRSSTFPGYAHWVGCYSFEEEPVQALAGYYMSELWSLTLTQDGHCRLEVDGQQTMIRYSCRVTPEGQGIAIWHLRDEEGNQFPSPTFDKPLFRLFKSNARLVTRFVAMEPILKPLQKKEALHQAFREDKCSKSGEE